MTFGVGVVDDKSIETKVFHCEDCYSWLDMLHTISALLKEGHSIHVSCVRE